MNKDTFFRQKHTLNLRGTLLDMQTTHIMGIVNVNEDSFYYKSRICNIDEILHRVAEFEKEGASFIDIGASSSRPGAILKSADEECKILVPIIEQLAVSFPKIFISIDTVYAAVAESCVNAGAHLINDISAGSIDGHMWPMIAGLKVPYVLMHMQGNPLDMQFKTSYPEGIVNELLKFFDEKLNELFRMGVYDVILDLGFGFGKTIEQNYELFRNQQIFDYFGCTQLLGVSRKSMIHKALNKSIVSSLNGSTVLHTLALAQGPKILRVHDVKEAMEVKKMVDWFNKGYNE